MQIDVKARNFSLTKSLRYYSEMQIHYALSCCADHILRVVMHLSNINSPHGGEDKLCHLQVVLTGLPDVVIEDIEADLYFAIDRATDRASRTVVRKIKHQQTPLKHRG